MTNSKPTWTASYKAQLSDTILGKTIIVKEATGDCKAADDSSLTFHFIDVIWLCYGYLYVAIEKLKLIHCFYGMIALHCNVWGSHFISGASLHRECATALFNYFP